MLGCELTFGVINADPSKNLINNVAMEKFERSTAWTKIVGLTCREKTGSKYCRSLFSRT